MLHPIVHPDTIVRWFRILVAAKYAHVTPMRIGRPGLMKKIEDHIVRIARENNTWGYTRVQGALANVGHQVSRSTVRRMLKRNGLEPAPRRGLPWKTFIEGHLGHIKAMDFSR